jgi:hypothetical protein
MAQYEYGFKMLGIAATGFTAIFLVQLILLFRKDVKRNYSDIAEMAGLVIIAIVLTFRVYYIRVEFVEILFGLAGAILIFIYIRKGIRLFSEISQSNRSLAMFVLLFYSSVSLYILSMAITPFVASLSEPMGMLAFGLLVIFILVNFLTGQTLYNGEEISPIKFVLKIQDRSTVLIILFLLFTAYAGAAKFGLLPKLYSDKYPPVYFELVTRAENGEEVPVNNTYKHEAFEDAYKKFVDRHNVVKEK